MKLDSTLPDLMLSRLSETNVAIFLFHGVIRKNIHSVCNYTGKHIEAELFLECMKKLSKSGVALSMDEILYNCSNTKHFPPNSFAITFDDGFENNISVAAPILVDLKIPSMIYVTSGFVDENGMSWIDRIELAVEEAPTQEIKVQWNDQTYRIDSVESRIDFLRNVRKYVKNTPNCDANSFADELCLMLGKSEKEKSKDELFLKMSWDQVKTANESEFISIGGHSHTHEILSFLSEDQLSHEIDLSLQLLNDHAGVSPTHYSYPEGLKHCFSDRVINVLKSRGVKCCPTAIDGINDQYSDPFHLKRVMINAD
jgi:peptidoglycan/xylan/chitin deacetylase (PgdA/CDA1 family)